jgi:sugar lactone lactonase YvrE
MKTRLCSVVALTILSSGCVGAQNAVPTSREALQSVSGDLFVANQGFTSSDIGDITVYEPGSSQPAYSNSDGIAVPKSLAFDSDANLYVSNIENSSISVYAMGSTSILRTITEHVVEPTSMVFDRKDNSIYVASSDEPNVTVFAAKNGAYLRTITKGLLGEALALGVDSAGNLYVTSTLGTGKGSAITVYNPRRSALIRTISLRTQAVSVLMVDTNNDLYVATHTAKPTFSITEYAANSSRIVRTISSGIHVPAALGLDASANLYVANQGSNTVTVYAPKSTKILRTISRGINFPVALAFSPSGFLNVANGASGHGSITQYAPGSGKVAGTITEGVARPDSLAFQYR